MKINLRKIFNVLLISIISILLIQENAVAEPLPGDDFQEQIYATNMNQGIEYLSDIYTIDSGIYIVASNDFMADISVDGIVHALGMGAYIIAGDASTNPQTTGDATLTVQSISGRTRGFTLYSEVDGAFATFVCNGNAIAEGEDGIGGVIHTTNGGEGDALIYQNVTGAISGIDFDLSYGGTSKVLVGGVISAQYGVRITGCANDNAFLTTWKIEHGENGDYIGSLGSATLEDIETFAKRIKYIIKHDENVVPKKADGITNLDINFEYSVAKEGEKVVITTDSDGVTIKKAFNNGVEITTKDENGNFYVIVPRGGGVSLSIETEAFDNKIENPITLKGKTVKIQATTLKNNRLTRAFTKAVKIIDAKGTLSFKKKTGTKKITINKTTGKITIKKGLKKGVYKIKVDVTASGDNLYNPTTKEVTFKVNVR